MPSTSCQFYQNFPKPNHKNLVLKTQQKQLMDYSAQIADFITKVEKRNPNEPEFVQAVKEVMEQIIPFTAKHPKYQKNRLLERLTEAERIIIFRVSWVNDKGEVELNRGYRVEMNSAIGPYKGGLRFHPTVNLSILKFLAFEQVFKNSLTSLPLGGGKGGSDFNPKGRSNNEIMAFCQSFMLELQRHIGFNTDVPAGDIGVGEKEVGYLFGIYKRIQNKYTGILTGKGVAYSGSLLRPEATGYGCVYFVEQMLKTIGKSIEGMRVGISGAGNVAQYACEKALELGARVISMSDSTGYLFVADGIDADLLKKIEQLKEEGDSLEKIGSQAGVNFYPGMRPWEQNMQIALPCATQNELEEEDAIKLIEHGCILVAEGANMPCTEQAVRQFHRNGVLFAPGKAANAGGVAVSGLEMSQNSMRISWTFEEVDDKLKEIMQNIHETCLEYGQDEQGKINYVKGANIAGFIKVADAMIAQGVV